MSKKQTMNKNAESEIAFAKRTLHDQFSPNKEDMEFARKTMKKNFKE